tara:strand:- start:9844 stop:10011 length:168 start_codon:yes stop_codon:yes gene_type:complete
MDLGHNSAIATSCADSARAKYKAGSNWKMGAVYAELSKEAKKVAGKVKKIKEVKS